MPPRRQLAHAGVAWIVGAFLVTRLLVLALYAPELGMGDQLQYVRVAASILDQGHARYLNPDFAVEKGDYYPYYRHHPSLPDGDYNPTFWDPLYPLFLSLVYRVAGVSHGAARGVQLLLSLLTLWIGMDAVRRMFPGRPRAPEWFGWMVVAYLPFAGFVTKLLGETLDAFLLTSIVWMTTRLPAARLAGFLGFGLLLGLYATIKSYWVQLFPAILVLVGWQLWRSDTRRVPALQLAGFLVVVLAGAALALTPSWIRNHNITGGRFLISTKGGWNLWKDNNNFKIVNHDWREVNVRVHPWLKAFYSLDPAARASWSPRSGHFDLEGVYFDEAVPEIRPPCDVGIERLFACERNRALAFFFEDPVRFVRRALMKTANLWSPNDYIFNRAPPGPRAWNQNYRVELPTPVRYLLQVWVILCYLLALLLCFVGITLPSESPAHRLARAFVALSLLYLTLVVVPWGHGVTRFRLPFMFPVLMFSALGLCHVAAGGPGLRRFDPGTPGRRVVSLTLAGLLAAVCVVKLPTILAP